MGLHRMGVSCRSYFHETKYLQPWSVNDQIRVFFHEDDGRLAATGNW